MPSCWDTMAQSSNAIWQHFTVDQVNVINLPFFPFLRNTIELLHKQWVQQQLFYYAVLCELKLLIWCCCGNIIICINWQCIMFVTCSTMYIHLWQCTMQLTILFHCILCIVQWYLMQCHKKVRIMRLFTHDLTCYRELLTYACTYSLHIANYLISIDSTK